MSPTWIPCPPSRLVGMLMLRRTSRGGCEPGVSSGCWLAGGPPLDAKLAAQTHDLMKKLDAATSRLQRVGIVVGIVGVGVMVLQLLVGWLGAHASGTI